IGGLGRRLNTLANLRELFLKLLTRANGVAVAGRRTESAADVVHPGAGTAFEAFQDFRIVLKINGLEQTRVGGAVAITIALAFATAEDFEGETRIGPANALAVAASRTSDADGTQ